MLVAFRDGDPNGNGEKDEIPLLGASAAVTLLNSFTYVYALKGNDMYLSAENGVITTTVNTDEYREGLRFLNKLVSEGLYSETSFTLDATQFNAIMNAAEAGEKAYVGLYSAHPTTTFTTDEGRLGYSPLFPVTGPEGVCYSIYAPQAQNYSLMITKYADKPEVAFRLLDAMCEETAAITSRWGAEGEGWDYVTAADGYESYYAAFGYEPVYVYYANPYEEKNNKIWRNGNFLMMPGALLSGQSREKGSGEADTHDNRMLNYAALRAEYIPDEIVGKIMYTPEESTSLGDMKTSLMSYIDESTTRFILGEMSVENDWDAYIDTLEAIGLTEYLKITQEAYTRTNSAGK